MRQIIVEEGPFDGILGFSQGASLAVGILLEEAASQTAAAAATATAGAGRGLPPHQSFTFAMLFSTAGLAELPGTNTSSSKRKKLDVPSLHVTGMEDGYFEASKAVTTLWQPGKATTLVHQQGHVVPRDARTTQQIVDAVEALLVDRMAY